MMEEDKGETNRDEIEEGEEKRGIEDDREER